MQRGNPSVLKPSGKSLIRRLSNQNHQMHHAICNVTQHIDSTLLSHSHPRNNPYFSSISYVFTLFGLSEEQAADSMVAICRSGGAEKISSANKLLFFGNHIFESAEALEKLGGIKDLIKSTYRSEAGADAIVDTSQ